MFTRQGFLVCSLFLASTNVFAADNTASVLEPVIERDAVALDMRSRDFEVAIVGGLINPDGFIGELGAGVKLGYHFYNNWFTEASLFQTDSVDNKMTITDLVLGYNLYQDTYINSDFRAQSSIYVIGGAGFTRFQDKNWETVVGGAGYRMMLSDNFSIRSEFRGNLHRDFNLSGWALDMQATLGLGYYF
jgi:opacity protein-like surface antigen